MTEFLDKINRDNLLIRLLYFSIGVFIAALIYNAVFVPNNIVVGGISGLAIIIKELTGLSTTTFINISNVLLVVISLIFLGKKRTANQLVGCIIYPMMVTLTAPLSKYFVFSSDSKLLVILLSSIIYGLANGIIYRAGFSTGGTDIITEIISSKIKKPITVISPIIHNTIIICSGIVFSPAKIIYAVSIIFISNRITDAILFGISTNKMVYVISKKSKDIEKYIMNEIHTGATEIKIHSGFFERKKQMILCVVNNVQYEKFKHNILKMDSQAFILSNNCYSVNGGVMQRILPF